MLSTQSEWTNGQLAKIAAWPDRVRGQYPWSGQLHYVTPLAPEHPPDSCAWSGEVKTQLNVLNGENLLPENDVSAL